MMEVTYNKEMDWLIIPLELLIEDNTTTHYKLIQKEGETICGGTIFVYQEESEFPTIAVYDKDFKFVNSFRGGLTSCELVIMFNDWKD